MPIAGLSSATPMKAGRVSRWQPRRGRDRVLSGARCAGCPRRATCALPITSSTAPGAAALYKAEVLPSDDPRIYSGVFDLANPRNPVADWSFVYVPYCTGDIHSGSRTAARPDATGRVAQVCETVART